MQERYIAMSEIEKKINKLLGHQTKKRLEMWSILTDLLCLVETGQIKTITKKQIIKGGK